MDDLPERDANRRKFRVYEELCVLLISTNVGVFASGVIYALAPFRPPGQFLLTSLLTSGSAVPGAIIGLLTFIGLTILLKRRFLNTTQLSILVTAFAVLLIILIAVLGTVIFIYYWGLGISNFGR